MRIPLAFGRGFHEIECPDHQTTVIEPQEGIPLPTRKLPFSRARAPHWQSLRSTDAFAAPIV